MMIADEFPDSFGVGELLFEPGGLLRRIEVGIEDDEFGVAVFEAVGALGRNGERDGTGRESD